MRVKNEAQRMGESEMDGLFLLPCELICSNASLRDKYSYIYVNAKCYLADHCFSCYSSVITTQLRPSRSSSAAALVTNLSAADQVVEHIPQLT